MDIIAVFKPNTGSKSICSNRAAEPYPAVANSPKTLIKDKIIKLPTDINNNAAEIGADWKNKLVSVWKLILNPLEKYLLF